MTPRPTFLLLTVEIVAFMLEQHGMTRADLVPILGSKSRVSEFFSGKRGLSFSQMKMVYHRWCGETDIGWSETCDTIWVGSTSATWLPMRSTTD